MSGTFRYHDALHNQEFDTDPGNFSDCFLGMDIHHVTVSWGCIRNTFSINSPHGGIDLLNPLSRALVLFPKPDIRPALIIEDGELDGTLDHLRLDHLDITARHFRSDDPVLRAVRVPRSI